MSFELAEDIRAIRDYVDEHGWTQGQVQASDGSVCLVGAAFVTLPVMTVDNRRSSFDARAFLREQIRARGDAIPPLGVGVLAYFNDYVLKSKEEALEFLDKAAIAAEEKA